ncbi:mitochondrial intermediate peptidase [Fomitiporia mediterranea MF3/22]|uniref:mitochondrial intermediate peptidase n=1 Tax=Fomitiporia mediterranea (strain MF3/22) TaxID=694068 RepID=UPI000440895F|nr:mitochondrial intermediate peptidase [Fomitiporia mediterranea MF3/22]EJD03583.1 mitochondrial intermediate peptidase [Fomitiporia mediterranea MF3/22]
MLASFKSSTSVLSRSRQALFTFRGHLRAPPHNALRLRPAATTAIPATSEETDLIPFFDRPYGHVSQSSASSGLFAHKDLTHPDSLTHLANGALIRASILTERILQVKGTKQDLLLALKNLDKLSDLLCGVIDLSEVVRNSHPDPLWVERANEAYDMLCEFMNVLNTHVGLYKVLERVFLNPEIVRSLSPEAYYTALIFWRDFEKSAINLPENARKKFVKLSSDIITLGRQFLNDASSPRPPALITPVELTGLKDFGMGARLQLQARTTNRPLAVYPGSLQAQMIMRSAPLEEPRRKLYIAASSGTEEQVETLEQLLQSRAQLARLCGKESYAHLTLNDKMAKSPEHVQSFLDALLSYTRPHARNALLALSERKQNHLGLLDRPIIQAWDRDYYCPPEPPSPSIPLPPLTPGTVFMALSRLFKHLYGVTLRPLDAVSGELWHPDVRKLEVVDKDAGVIGWIYADLFARKGKASGAAHYTVRCSRRTDNDDPEADTVEPLSVLPDDTIQMSLDFDQEHRVKLRGVEGEYQLPVVVLLCEFMPPSPTRGASALHWHDVQTLFHEMGHAMHSMIGRTEYQNVSGTRCATDFVELPSILMEHFLTSPTILSLFDHTNQNSVPRAGNHHIDACHSIDTYTQILLACLDQEYHSPLAAESNFDSTRIYAKLQETKGLIPFVPGTAWQTQFGHLYGYGATYYSYLFDRAIASRIWTHVFTVDPLSREAGARFKDEVLKFGGGKDPWRIVSKILDSPELESGDANAMATVGSWRIEDEILMRH